MRKCICLFLAILVFLSLGACGGRAESSAQAKEESTTENVPESSQDANSPGDLSLLYHMQRQVTANFTENGYYRLTFGGDRLADGRSAQHLMYIDFATRQEIYLCSNTACAHDTEDCSSVFSDAEFGGSTAIFVWNNYLYILSKEQDHDGSVVMGLASSGADAVVEAGPTTLYRAALDGTNREKIYTFDPVVTVEDLVVGDEDGLYLITKKVTTEQSEGATYQTSSERKLIYLDLSAKKETELFSLNFNDGIDWDVIGCSGRKLIVYGVDFGREVSVEEKHSDSRSLYSSSSDVFATLDVDSGSLHEIYRVNAPMSRSYAVDTKMLYYSVIGDGQIVSVDLKTGEQKILCKLSQDAIWGMCGDRLYTRDDNDRTLYFISTDTGEMQTSMPLYKPGMGT